MHSVISGIISDYEGMWRPLAAVCIAAFGCGVLQEFEARFVTPWRQERKRARSLGPLELTLPGFEEAIASQGGRRWSDACSSAGQPVDQARGRVRIEPTLDKPVR
jgi:hypothetical protein